MQTIIAEEAEMNARTIAPQRTMRDYVRLFFQGIGMGTCDVIPGVSGGTMAFLFGIYEELIRSIKAIGEPTFLKALAKFRLSEAARAINLPFLLALGLGIGTAIISLAKLMQWLLANQPIPVWSFFFGLILASVYVVGNRIKKWNALLIIGLAAGTIGAYYLVGLVPTQTPDNLWFIFISGMVAICAMILPGISGAFILVLLGKYLYMIRALTNRDIVPIGVFGAGALIGLVTFSHVLNWLFRKYHDMAVAVLTGFMLGSLRKVWPWKVDVAWITKTNGELLPTVQNNILPGFTTNGSMNMEVLTAIALALAGFAVVIMIERIADKRV